MENEKLKPMLFTVLKGYSAKQFAQDLVSGIIVAIIALPLSIALALASGVGPEEGLYTAIVAGFIISFLGGSRVQIAGPTAAFATIVAGIVANKGMEGLALATIFAGILLIIMGVLKLGSLIKFIPYTITTGFTAGIAVTIAIGQVKDFLGLTYPAGTPTVETTEKVTAIAGNIGTFNYQALIVGLICLLIQIVWPKVSKKIPGSLIAVIVGILIVKFLGLNVNTIGDLYEIKGQLPTLHIPSFDFATVRSVAGDGFTIAILAAIESLLSCVVADSMIDSKHRSNMELVAQGAGNIGSALFGGIPATGTIAAILFMVAYNMCQYKTFLHLLKTAPKSDIIVLVTTFVLTVVFDLVVAIEVGMVLACLLFMKRMSEESRVHGWKYYDPEDDPDGPGLKDIPKHVRVYEISGPMFFGDAEQIAEISFKDFTRALVIRMRGVPAIDATAMHSLEQLYEKCKKNNIQLVFSHVNEQPMNTMEKDGFVDLVGRENFQPHIDEALKRAAEI